MSTRLGPRAAGGLLVLAALAALGGAAAGQSVGPGASPGRAAYRPPGQWNDGPFFTAPHVDPYAPKPSVTTALYSSEPQDFPWSNGPHGLYNVFYPRLGTLYPYAEGFSPYSGFAGWYQQAYGFTPTRADVVRARAAFFRSAPVPPPGVLPPLPPAPRGASVAVAATRVRGPARPASGKGVVPGSREGAPKRSGIPVYRGGLPGVR